MTKAFKHVLIPIDFSDDSELAAKVALERFGDSAETVTLLTVCEMKGDKHREIPQEIDDMVLANIKKTSDAFAEKHKDKHKNLKTVIKKGQAAAQILTTAKEMDVDLIVMGSQGRSSLARVFFGSTTYDVARKAHCSIFAIRT